VEALAAAPPVSTRAPRRVASATKRSMASTRRSPITGPIVVAALRSANLAANSS
jgi:hypothetical protein